MTALRRVRRRNGERGREKSEKVKQTQQKESSGVLYVVGSPCCVDATNGETGLNRDKEDNC